MSNLILKKIITLIFFVFLININLVSNSYASEPITSKDYQTVIGRGLATSWFKKYPVKGYSDSWLKEIKNKGFDHIRIRVAAADYKGSNMSLLTDVIDKTLEAGLIPIISWVNHEAEHRASDTDQKEYLDWWEELATSLKGKSYLIGYNLFTEISNESGLAKKNRYNKWTKKAVEIIRRIDPQRIIILSAPSKTVKSIVDIDRKIYDKDPYMLVEWHLYASGPNKRKGDKQWSGKGSKSDRGNVTSIFKKAKSFTNKTGIPTYFGAWMPMDNNYAKLKQGEVEAFANFFVQVARKYKVPWTLNADMQFIDIDNNQWFKAKSWGKKLTLDMERILNVVMGKTNSKVSNCRELITKKVTEKYKLLTQKYISNYKNKIKNGCGNKSIKDSSDCSRAQLVEISKQSKAQTEKIDVKMRVELNSRLKKANCE